jgi:hypothetical protein
MHSGAYPDAQHIISAALEALAEQFCALWFHIALGVL